MSYIRPLDGSGLYIFPEDNHIMFMSFPDHSGKVVPDDMLDILLYKMDSEELIQRQAHGKFLLEALRQDDMKTYKENINFWKEGRKW